MIATARSDSTDANYGVTGGTVYLECGDCGTYVNAPTDGVPITGNTYRIDASIFEDIIRYEIEKFEIELSHRIKNPFENDVFQSIQSRHSRQIKNHYRNITFKRQM